LPRRLPATSPCGLRFATATSYLPALDVPSTRSISALGVVAGRYIRAIDGTLLPQSRAALRVLLCRTFRAASQLLGSASLARLASHLKFNFTIDGTTSQKFGDFLCFSAT